MGESSETTKAELRGAVLAANKSNPDVTEYQLYSLPLGSMFRCHYPNMAGDIPHTYPPRQLPNPHPFDEGWLLDVTQGRCVVYVTRSEKRESYAHETPVEFLGVDEDMAKLIEEEQGKADKRRNATRLQPVPETPTDLLQHHVTGAIERGEAEAVVEIPMVTSNQHLPDDPKHRTIVVRWNFQLKQLVGALEGGNDARAEQARKAIIKVADDATEQGMTSLPSEVEFSPILQGDSVFTLDEVARLLVAAPAVAMSKNLGVSAGENERNTSMATSVNEAPVAGSVQDGKQKAKAKAAAAKQTSGASTPAPAKEKKAPKPLNDCLDGCGAKVKGRFAMGHDAKLKSLILKIERGDEARDTIPEVAQPYVSFVKGETEVQKIDGKDVKVQLYNCTKAPVRFPGRSDIEYAE